MKLRFTLIALTLLMHGIFNAQEVKTSKFGKGLINAVGQDSSWTMKVGLRMQLLGSSIWEEKNKSEISFLARRARLKFDGYAVSPRLKYKIELGISNRDLSGASQFTHNAPRYILDALLKWNFYKNFELWFGQGKLPGNRERVISSANLQQVDRSLLNKRFTIDRDFGFQLRHKHRISNNFVVKEIFSLAQGEGRNVTTGNLGGHQYTGRVELFPFGEFASKGDYKGADLNREQKPKLSLAVSYDHNNNAVKTRSNQGSYMTIDDGDGFFETNINTWFIDAMFKYNGFSLMAEYSERDAKDPFAKNSNGSLLLNGNGDNVVVEVGHGLNIQTGLMLRNDWEVSARYTTIELDKGITGKNPEQQYTIGLSKYIVGHSLKMQTDVSHLEVSGGNNELMYRLQFDIHF